MPGMQPNPTTRLRRELRSACLGRVWDYCSTVIEQKSYEVTGEGSVARKLFDPRWCTADGLWQLSDFRSLSASQMQKSSRRQRI